MTDVVVAAGLVRVDTDKGPRFVVTLRAADAHLGGQWELPGGKVATGEPPSDALRRELHEELGITVSDVEPLCFSHHVYATRTVLLLFFSCTTDPGCEPRPLQADALKLVTHDELVAHPFPAGNAPLIRLLRRLGQPK